MLNKVCLVKMKTENSVQTYMVEANSFAFGRSQEVLFPINDVGISRNHMQVSIDGDALLISDLGSANGTIINGKRIDPQTPYKYTFGEEIFLGSSKIRVSLDLIDKKVTAEQKVQSQETAAKDARDAVSAAMKEAQQIIDSAKKDVVVEEEKLKKIAAQVEIAQAELQTSKSEELKVKDSLQRHTVELQKVIDNKELVLRETESKTRRLEEDAEVKVKVLIHNAEKELESAKKKSDEQIQQANREAELIRAQIQQLKNDANTISTEARERAEKSYYEIVAEGEKQAASIVEKAKSVLEDLKLGAINEGKIVADDIIRKAELEIAGKRNLISALENQIKEIGAQKQSAEEQCREQKEKLSKIVSDVDSCQKKVDAAKAELAEIDNRVERQQMLLVKQQNEVKSLEERQLLIEDEMSKALEVKAKAIADAEAIRFQAEEHKQSSNAEIIRLQAQVKSELAEFKRKEEAQIRELNENALKNIEKLQRESLQKIKDSRDTVVVEIANHLTTSLANQFVEMHGKNWAEVSLLLEDTVKTVVDEEIYKAEAAIESKAKESAKSTFKQKNIKRIKWTAVVVLALALLILLVPSWRMKITGQLAGVNDKGETSAQEYARKMREERALIKFEPSQTEDLKNTYTDNVLYTLNYLQIKQDQKVQEKWIKDLNKLLVNEMKLDEDLIVKVVATENTLLSQLKEKKGEINPDFVDDGIRKMRTFETEMVARLKILLKNPENYEKFLQYSASFYNNEVASRKAFGQ